MPGPPTYNAALSPASLWDPWGDEEPNLSPAHDAYLGQLDEFDAMARVRIPQIAVDLPIFHDATKLPLSRGVGHMYGTSLPVGGPDTHAVLAGHTALRGRTMFDRLPEVRLDQDFYIDAYGATLTYRVDRITVVEPWELEAVERVPGADHVTLVTCYTPPGQHKQRLLVRGVRVPDAPAAAPADSGGQATQAAPAAAPATVDTSIQDWMVPRLALTGGSVVLALLMTLGWIVGDRRDARRLPTAPGPDDDPRRAEADVPEVEPDLHPREPVEAAR